MNVNASAIPASLRERPQWVCWANQTRKGKLAKVPFDPRTGRRASSTDSATWASFDEAAAACERFGCDGIGYVFAADDPHCGIDLDACHDPATGKLTPWAESIVKRLASYTEVSPSGFGVKMIVQAKLRPGHNVKKVKDVPTYGDKSPEIALYDTGRFFCITGQHVAGTPRTIEARQTELDGLYDELWPAKEKLAAAQEPTGEIDRRVFELLADCANAAEGERSERDFALCAECIRRGLNREAVQPLAESVGKFAERGAKYFELTWGRAAEAVATDRLNLLDIAGRNDAANARRFIAWHGATVRYCDAWKRWLIFDGRRWAVDETRAIEALAKQAADRLWAEYRRLDHRELDEKLLREVRQFIRATNGAAGIQNFLALARSEPGVAIRAEQLDTDPWSLNVENGTLDLRDGKLRLHNKDEYLTKLAPVAYDPAATCPGFDAYLERILGKSAALIEFIFTLARLPALWQCPRAKNADCVWLGREWQNDAVRVNHADSGRLRAQSPAQAANGGSRPAPDGTGVPIRQARCVRRRDGRGRPTR